MSDYGELESEAQGFLLYAPHASRRGEAERHLRNLLKILKRRYPEESICPKCGGKVPITLEVQNVSITADQLFGGNHNG